MLNVDTLTYNKTAIRGLALEATLVESEITVNRVEATNLAGAKASFDGTIIGLPDAPAAKGRFSLEAQSLDGVARLAAIDLPVAAADLGPTIAGGEIDYTAEKLTVDMDVATAGGTWKIAGTVTDPIGAPTFDLAADLAHPDIDRLATLVALELPEAVEGLGAVALKGTVKGSAQDVELDVDVAAGGGTAKIEGSLANMATSPGYDLAIESEFPDAVVPLRLAGLDGGGNIAGLGRFNLTGTLKSTEDAVEMDLAVELGDGGLSAVGRVDGLAAGPRYVGDFAAEHPDLGALIAAVSPDFEAPNEDLGGFALTLTADAEATVMKLGDLKGNLGPIDFDGADGRRSFGRSTTAQWQSDDRNDPARPVCRWPA